MKYSDTAFQVYDSGGEKAMVSFLFDNRDEGAIHDNPGIDPFLEGVFPLPDKTRVTVSMDGKTYQNSHTGETRPRTIPDEQIPPFPMLPVPLFDWPDSADVRTRAVQTVVQTAVRNAGLWDRDLAQGDGPVLRTADAMILAPGLDIAVTQAIEERRKAGVDEEVARFLEEAQNWCAQEALKLLPAHERAALEQKANGNVLQRAPAKDPEEEKAK